MSHIPSYQGRSGSDRQLQLPNSQSEIELQSYSDSLTDNHDTEHDCPASDYDRLVETPVTNSETTIWEQGFWAQFPTLGLFALFGVLASTVAMIVILEHSDGKRLEEWPYNTLKPSVYLSILSAMANTLLAYALTEGLVTSFWRTALHGRTLRELNQNWLCGQSLYRALLQGYHTGGRITAAAYVLSALSFTRGPLKQAASSVSANQTYLENGNLSIAVAQRLPNRYTALGGEGLHMYQKAPGITTNFTKIMQDYSLQIPIHIDLDNHLCVQNDCKTSIKGFGFNVACNSKDIPNSTNSSGYEAFKISTELKTINEEDPESTGNYISSYVFHDVGITLTAVLKDRPQSDDVGSIVNFKHHSCDLTGGIVEYQVRILNQIITLSAERSNDRFLETISPLWGLGAMSPGSVMGGFHYAADYLFTSDVQYTRKPTDTYTFTGALANENVIEEEAGFKHFQNPMDRMLDNMREIAFRTAVDVGRDPGLQNETDALQNVPYEGEGRQSIYITDTRFMIAAAILSLSSIVAVATTFYGWWKLGRTVSLNPLELAKAFDAPLLREVGSNITVLNPKALGPTGLQRVQYGEQPSSYGDDLKASRKTAHKRLVIGTLGM